MFSIQNIFLYAAWMLSMLLICDTLKAQVGVNTTEPHPRAVIDIDGKGKMGLLIPAIPSAGTVQLSEHDETANGMLYYDLSTHRFMFYNSAELKPISSPWNYSSTDRSKIILEYYNDVEVNSYFADTLNFEDLKSSYLLAGKINTKYLVIDSLLEADLIYCPLFFCESGIVNTRELFIKEFDFYPTYSFDFSSMAVDTLLNVFEVNSLTLEDTLKTTNLKVTGAGGDPLWVDAPELYIAPTNAMILWPDSQPVPDGWEWCNGENGRPLLIAPPGVRYLIKTN